MGEVPSLLLVTDLNLSNNDLSVLSDDFFMHPRTKLKLNMNPSLVGQVYGKFAFLDSTETGIQRGTKLTIISDLYDSLTLSDADQDCCICMEKTLFVSGIVMRTACNHDLHETCLRNWSKKQCGVEVNGEESVEVSSPYITCPICRTKYLHMDSETIKRVESVSLMREKLLSRLKGEPTPL